MTLTFNPLRAVVCGHEVCNLIVDVLRLLLYFSITRTFASGKTEKMIMQCLKDLGFASGKVRSLWSLFSNVNVPQGSVATLIRYDGISSANFIANFLTSQPVKELWKSAVLLVYLHRIPVCFGYYSAPMEERSIVICLSVCLSMSIYCLLYTSDAADE